MSQKSYYMHLYSHISKHKLEISHYLLKNEPNEIFNSVISPLPTTEEISKYTEISKKSFVWQLELEKILNENDDYKIRECIEKNLESHLPKGNAKKLLEDLFLSIIKFCKNKKYNCIKTRIFLVQCYNVHQYFASNLWRIPEDIYSFFKQLILCHSVLLPPDTMQIFLAKECQEILVYFYNIYIKNLPLIKLLMFPNYGFILSK